MYRFIAPLTPFLLPPTITAFFRPSRHGYRTICRTALCQMPIRRMLICRKHFADVFFCRRIKRRSAKSRNAIYRQAFLTTCKKSKCNLPKCQFAEMLFAEMSINPCACKGGGRMDPAWFFVNNSRKTRRIATNLSVPSH